LAVIPARGGSKRIPRKNLRLFHGKPIVVYSIEAALGSALFDHVVVSTDDDEIAELALGAGAEVPFRRPQALADDHTGTNAVARHAIEWFAQHAEPVTSACCLYATAPFVTAGDLRASQALLGDDTDFVFAATRFRFPVQRALARDTTGLVSPMFPQWIQSRSQDLPDAIHDAGQFYWGWAHSFQDHASPFLARARAHELPTHRVQDIDTLEDWTHAELLFQLAAART
jgi:pseudaminic acid cytidylyltransferase